MAEIDDVRYDVAIANRILRELGLATGVRASLGHASMRVPGQPDKFVVKGRGYRIDVLSRMRPEEMVTCDLDGNWVDGPPGSLQCHEVKIHSSVYKARPDVNSVVHVHPKYTVLMSVLGKTLVPMAQEGIRANDGQTVQDPLPVYPHAKTVITDEEGTEVVNMLGKNSAMLLFGHGAITAAAKLEDAVLIMAHIEHQAEYNYLAVVAAGADHPRVPQANVDHMKGEGSFVAPHFARRIASGGRPWPGGIWNYYTQVVGADM